MISTARSHHSDPSGRRLPGISCIIPAYNEGPRIKAVLDVVAAHPLIDEIIVVDDGSSDDTAALASGREKVVLIRLSKMAARLAHWPLVWLGRVARISCSSIRI